MRDLVVFSSIGFLVFGTLAAYAEPTAVIVAWDGGKPSVVQRLIEQGRLPTLQALMGQGSYTFQAQTILPSKTLPSFTSMLTGVSPQRHGVLWNDYDPGRGWVPVPTVFEVLKRAQPSARTAMVFSKKKLRHLVRPGTLDAVEEVDEDALQVAEVAVRLIQSLRPHLLFVHLRDPDRAGHLHGWGDDARGQPPSAQFVEALQRCDRALGVIVEALRQNDLWEATLLIVTADHGGRGYHHGSSDPQDMRIPWIAAGGLAAPAGVLTRTIHTMDTAATALAALGQRPPLDWDGQPVWEALRIELGDESWVKGTMGPGLLGKVPNPRLEPRRRECPR
ncbi:MAG: alkaline phosphatase family protein [Acidobacteria bacterium]|nr:alkaline phosphatase family protein [Acidobacteriota bacterium]MDW7984260.1 alkaline phosphatase family protein [Acidobacteriota bacterium]